jgi:hypothetical protein
LDQVTRFDHLGAQARHVALVDAQHPNEVLLRRRDVTTLTIEKRHERMCMGRGERDATWRLVASEKSEGADKSLNRCSHPSVEDS